MAILQTIEWTDESGQVLVQRWPQDGPGNVSLGAQLTVRESQAAVFFRDGQALDVFGPGRHTLTTLNLPLLQTLIAAPFGGDTPFQAEVYFVNMRVMTDMKWGTPEPILFRDKELDFVRLRSYGAYTMRITQPQLFVNMVVGTEHIYTQDQAMEWLRNFIVTRFTDVLGQTLTSILDLAQHYNELGVAAKARLSEDFSRYGIELDDFLIEAITPPEEVAQMLDQRASMKGVGDMRQFLQYRTAQAIGEMPQAGGTGGGAGSTAGLGAGLGAGVAMGGAMMEAMRDAFKGGDQPAAPAPSGTGVSPVGPTCPQCHQAVPAGAKFCPNCGASLEAATCTCGAELPAGAKFCPACGKPA
ncbi:MAG TPA: SPFH domain-containing protein [Armatimonadota bacterium]|jgi:membrane protease subunit (stomatin/prohibitin family)